MKKLQFLQNIFVLITAFSFFIFVLPTALSANAASVCYGGGHPAAGKGGNQGDQCNPNEVISGIGDVVCCKIPDGDATKSLFCDTGKANSTYGTCQPATGKQGDYGCKKDMDCDQAKDLKCDIAAGKCVPNGCSKTAGADCTNSGNNGCCKSANLTCADLNPGKNNSPRQCQSTTCSHDGGKCGAAGGSCCLGENLSCKNDKCLGPTTGGSCKGDNVDCTSNEECCPNLGLSCDLNHLVNQSGSAKCVTQDQINKATQGPTDVPPPSPPCMQGGWSNGQCTSFITALGQLDTDTSGFTSRVFAVLLSFAGGIALLLIIRAGYNLITSQGKPEQVQNGRDQLIAAIVGLVFLIFSLVLLQVIGFDILKVPGLTADSVQGKTCKTNADCSGGLTCNFNGTIGKCN